jgi:hypothetical protein
MLLLAVWGLWRYLRLRRNALQVQTLAPHEPAADAVAKD